MTSLRSSTFLAVTAVTPGDLRRLQLGPGGGLAVHGAGLEEPAGDVAAQLVGGQLQLLAAEAARGHRAGRREEAGGHVVGHEARLGGNVLEQLAGLGVGPQLLEDVAQARAAEDAPFGSGLGQAIGEQARDGAGRERNRGLAQAGPEPDPERR